jgi:hypothetical protein
MSKRLRPSLKDYLKTGEVRLETLPGLPSSPSGSPAAEDGLPARTETSAPKIPAAVEYAGAGEDARVFLNLLSESDRQIWEPVLRSGTEIRRPLFDAVSLREDFRLMDRTRFTYYIVEERNASLRTIRTSVQIREPFVLLLKWDETGVLDIYYEGKYRS